jgi:hypothetical protein
MNNSKSNKKYNSIHKKYKINKSYLSNMIGGQSCTDGDIGNWANQLMNLFRNSINTVGAGVTTVRDIIALPSNLGTPWEPGAPR